MSWKWKGEPGHGYSRLYKALVPVAVRRWGGYGRWFVGRYGWKAWRARGYRYSRYIVNLARDIEARAMGYCNHAPWPAQGGYSHWRCARQRNVCRVMGTHRINNYVWPREGGAHVMHEPIPISRHPVDIIVAARSKPYRDRYLTRTIRQGIAWRRIMRAERVASDA